MHTKVLTSLLLTTFIATSLLRSVSTSYQGGGRLTRQAQAGPQQERMQRSSSGGPIRREWPGHLSEDQKDLVAQFLPYLRTGRRNDTHVLLAFSVRPFQMILVEGWAPSERERHSQSVKRTNRCASPSAKLAVQMKRQAKH